MLATDAIHSSLSSWPDQERRWTISSFILLLSIEKRNMSQYVSRKRSVLIEQNHMISKMSEFVQTQNNKCSFLGTRDHFHFVVISDITTLLIGFPLTFLTTPVPPKLCGHKPCNQALYSLEFSYPDAVTSSPNVQTFCDAKSHKRALCKRATVLTRLTSDEMSSDL